MLRKSIGYVLASMVLIGLSNAIYFTKFTGEIWNDKDSSLIENLEVKYDALNDNFPDVFYIQFHKLGVEFDLKFTKSVSNLSHNDDVYVIDSETGNLKKLDLPKIEEFEHYEQETGDGFVTLIKNLQPEGNNLFRMIGTIYSEDKIAFDIMPIVVQDGKRRKRNVLKADMYDSFNNHHSISKRSVKVDEASQIIDYLYPPKSTSRPPVNNGARFGNKAGTKPFNLYVELLAVVDLAAINFFKNYTQITNEANLFTYMRIYYAHVYKMVNYRYVCSLQNDPDLRINVVMSNILLLNNPANQTWLNSNYIYNGRGVITITQGLNGLINFMNSLNPQLNYDAAYLFTNKDIFDDDTTQTDASRSSVIGVAYLDAACSAYRYALVEELGSLYNVEVVAHELGHTLGSEHDGSGAGFACSPYVNNIMAPVYGYIGQPYYLSFSSCSIAQFKTYLLTTALDAVSSNGQCLLNVPSNLPVETSYVVNTYPGQIWSADDQCRMYFGANASFFRASNSLMCTGLICFKDFSYVNFGNIPNAAEGTTCDSGKICINNTCVASPIAPKGVCLFEDKLVTQVDLDVFFTPPLVMPKAQLTCAETINLIVSSGKSPLESCLSSINFKCCGVCESYRAIKCTDYYSNCADFKSQCATGNFTLYTGQKVPVKDLCQVACNNCPASPLPLRCPNNTYICQNGGTCVNTTTSADGLIAFRCNCPPEYTGSVCETKVPPCLLNPCKNGGTCVPLGSLSFFCSCPTGCSGIDCSTCGSLTSSTTRTSTRTSTTTPTRTTTRTSTTTPTRTTTRTSTTTPTRTTTRTSTMTPTRTSTRTTTCSCKCG